MNARLAPVVITGATHWTLLEKVDRLGVHVCEYLVSKAAVHLHLRSKPDPFINYRHLRRDPLKQSLVSRTVRFLRPFLSHNEQPGWRLMRQNDGNHEVSAHLVQPGTFKRGQTGPVGGHAVERLPRFPR